MSTPETTRTAKAEPALSLLPSLEGESLPYERVVSRAVGIALGIGALLVASAFVAAVTIHTEITISAAGVLEPALVAPVRARESGVLAGLSVTLGTEVQKGAVVGWLDTLEAASALQSLRVKRDRLAMDLAGFARHEPLRREQNRIAVAQAQAGLLRARALMRERLVDARLEPNVDSVLRWYRPGTHIVLDGAVADLLTAQGVIDAARSREREEALEPQEHARSRLDLRAVDQEIAIAEARRARLLIVAPISGTVLTENIQRLVGGAVRQGDSLFEVADRLGWRARMRVNEHDVHLVRAGDRVSLEVPALSEFDDGKLDGRVESVGLEAGAVQAGRADYSVVVSLDTAGLRRVGTFRLNRGYTVTGTIVTRSGSVLAMLRHRFVGAH